ncbi:hypothetical protein QEZ48_00550 [Aquamicrobium lusatiense]|uniref:hypothetical protein n=1 Tax=Aquamicrobium lusatiense TaxID=89772 RepID=UPI002455C536|nr:hypothetical protein [Aquamicrobium lusatiense]MDH4989324.1 hypothetical protein [Aquamicrobium lusatiense]
MFWTEKPHASAADHRLPEHSLRDANGNGVPDLVENVARQADAARRAFVHLGFRDPLENPGYRAVKHIDINMLSMRFNGRAYDAAVHYPGAPGRGTGCTLRIDISTHLESHMVGSGARRRRAEFTQDWFVVAHEMFHLFQYGRTPLKRSWINEPTAKWAEYALRRGDLFPPGHTPDILPSTFEEFELSVIRHPTGPVANRFWSRLIRSTEQQSVRTVLPPELRALAYTDGRPVLKDHTIRGAPFVSRILEEMAALSSKVLTTGDRVQDKRMTIDRISPRRDRALLDLIRSVARDQAGENPRGDAFETAN